jgi:hypothetical protein
MVVPNDVRKVRLKLAEYMRAQGSVARASLLKSRDRRLRISEAQMRSRLGRGTADTRTPSRGMRRPAPST